VSVPGFVAVARFGLGARPGEIPAASRDPRGWLRAQLDPVRARPAALAGIDSGDARAGLLQRAQRERGAAGVENLLRQAYRAAFVSDLATRLEAQIASDSPFVERLVGFWSNHFAVSVQRPIVLGLAVPFEREAIRPHVLGRFADMLVAATRHQAMLIYLDNARSIGPNSRIGQRRGRGLNENHAREILELHTLGVGGYGQEDVLALARILTGWSVARGEGDGDAPSTFVPAMHEPGDKTLLGTRYPEAGEAEGLSALAALAGHPATARHIALKLARHFIADDPPASAVARLGRVFQETGGDLRALALVLIEMPAAWDPPLTKVKTPYDLMVSAVRASGYRVEGQRLVASLRVLGQVPFAPPSPAGWPDEAERWIGPEAVMRRAEWSMVVAQRIAAGHAPGRFLQEIAGPVASDETRRAVERAPSAADGLALALMSPEFQRR